MPSSSDRSRFEQLVECHHAAVYRAAHRVLRSQSAAEDATQDVFLRVLDGRLDVPAGSHEEARGALVWWAVRTAWNTLRGETRRMQREGRHAMERKEAERQEGMAGADAALTDERLWQTVGDLTDDLRVPLVLRFVDGITFAKIGEALGIGESAAHERVSKALGRLRSRFGQLGLGALAPMLEAELAERLPRVAAEVSVPPGLEVELVALQGVATSTLVGGSFTGKLVLTVAAVCITVACVQWWPFASDQRAPERERALRAASLDSADTVDPVTLVDDSAPLDVGASRVERAPATGNGSNVAAIGDESGPRLAPAIVEGRVVDGTGAGLDGVQVLVSSIELAGKEARTSARARTDVNGWYRATVEVAHADGANFVAAVWGRDFVGLAHSAEVRLTPGATASLEPLVAEPRALVDHAAELPFLVTPGADAEASGATIRGTIRLVQPLAERPLGEQVRVYATHVSNGSWTHGEVLGDGSFAIAGLQDGPYRVHVVPDTSARRTAEEPFPSSTWFDLDVRDGRPTTTGHDVLLKRADDPRDVGHHAAEVHGIVVASATGAPVDVDRWTLDLDSAPELSPEEYRRDWLPNHVFPAPAQRMLMGPEPEPSPRIGLTGLAAGRYVLRCNRRGFASYVSEPFTLGEREVRTDTTVRLEAPCSVAGRVLDPRGLPLENALVLVTGYGPISEGTIAAVSEAVRGADGRGYLHINGTEVRTDVDGAFVLDALPSGVEFRLVALHAAHEPVHGARFVLASGEARRGDELRFARSSAR